MTATIPKQPGESTLPPDAFDAALREIRKTHRTPAIVAVTQTYVDINRALGTEYVPDFDDPTRGLMELARTLATGLQLCGMDPAGGTLQYGDGTAFTEWQADVRADGLRVRLLCAVLVVTGAALAVLGLVKLVEIVS